VERIDNELCLLEDRQDDEARERKEVLNRRRDHARPGSVLAAVARRVPLLRRYRRPIDATIRRHVVELLRSLGIPNPENVAQRYPHELSGGMQQRIVIAIALACHPTLLVADEPTSNLDVTIQAQIVELIKELKRTTISSVLFITHDLGLVAEVCDRVTVMYAGDVSETATVRDLFREPLHPYTRGLLASVPKADQQEELSMIPGAVPNLIRPPEGCRFHPRCPKRMEICEKQKPPTVEHSPGHWVACHLYTGGAGA
jgi:peptide/nickel transport system ATP-binding protein